MMNELKGKPLDVQKIKNFEHARLYESDDEEEETKKPQIGTTRAEQVQEQEVDKRSGYRCLMKDLQAKTPANFIDSFHFQ